MIETFLFLRLGEEKVCWNVAEKLEKYWRQEATSLENVYLSQYYVLSVRLLTAMIKWVIPVTIKSQ